MAEQEPSILGQLAPDSPVNSSLLSDQEQRWLKEQDRVYNPSVVPINPSVNANTIGNLPTGPASPIDPRTGSTENYARGIVDMINTSNQWANDPYSYSQPFSYGAGWRDGNFERYYSSPSFKKLGYFPGRDNEAIYNENTGFLGDFARMVPQMASLTVDAAMDMASEWGSWGLDNPDTAMAQDFQKAMAVGMSSQGGIGGFVTNLGLNLAYPIGITAEWFAEDLALAGITALTGGTASSFTIPTMIARGTKAAKNIYESLTDIGKLKSSYDAIRSIKSVNNAREFINAAKLNKLADFINPFESTAKFIRGYDKIKGLEDWAKISRGAEALYRDARLINAVTGEAKLEAGFRKIEQTDELINNYYNENGKLPTGQELEDINKNAGDAAFYVGLVNMPMIFLTDKIIFDTAFKGSKYLKAPEVVGEDILARTGEKLIVEDGVAKVVKKASIENLKSVFTPKALASRSMRYLGKNFAQGLQETTQDIIQDTFKDYYSRVYKDPTSASMMASLGTGLSGQLTAQGFETFMSGFFMGGAMGVVQNTLFNGIMGIGYKTIAPEGYGKWRKDVDNYVNTFVNFYNQAKKDPSRFSSALRGLDSALVRSKDMAAFADASGLDTDSVKEVIDAKDEQAFQVLISFIEAGHGNHIPTLINEFKSMDNAELAAAFGVDPNLDHANSDARKRLDVFEKRINLANELWRESLRDMPNPIDLKKAQKENNRVAEGAYYDFEKYRRLAVFHFYSLQRTLDRQESIYNAIINDSKLGNIPSTEISPLLSMTAINQHIDTLRAEIKALKEIDPKEYKRKESELKLYEDYNKLLTNHFELFAQSAQLNLIMAQKKHGEELLDIQQATKSAVEASKRKVKAAYRNIIKRAAGKYDIPLLDKDINNSFSLVHDHYLLAVDAHDISRIADVLTNPENMRDLVNRWLPEVRQAVEKEKLESIKQGLEEFFGKQALDTLTKKLSTIGIVIPDDELIKLMKKPAQPITSVIDMTSNKRIPLTEGKGLEAKAIIDTWLAEVNAPSEVPSKEAPVVSTAVPEPGVGPETVVPEPVPASNRIGTDVPLAKYPAELKALRDQLQAAYEEVKKVSPEISEKTFLEGLVAMEIMDDYYSGKEIKPAQKAVAAPVVPPVAQPAPTTSLSDIEIKKADIENRRKESLNGIREVQFANGSQWEGYYDTGKESTVSGTNIPSSRKLVEKVLKFTKEDTIAEINARYDKELARVLYKETIAGKPVTEFTIEEQRIINTYVTPELAKSVDEEISKGAAPVVEKKLLPLSNDYRGKIVYVSPGGGKTWLFMRYSNVIDTDELLAEGMRAAGMNIESGETIGQAITRHFNTTPDRMNRIYEEVSMNMQNLADLGLTVLTGSNRFIPIADRVIITEDDQRLADNLKGGISVEAFRTKELDRLQQPGKAGRTVDYMTTAETLEDLLTRDVSEGGTAFDPIAVINQSRDLSELKANWETVVNHYTNTQALIPEEIDVVYQAKLKDLTRDITHKTVEVGSKLKVKNNVRSTGNTNFVELFAGNIVEVVSKNSKGVYVIKVDSLPTSGKKRPIYLTNNRFDAMGAYLYDANAPDETIPTPDPANEAIAKANDIIQEDEAKKNADLIAQRRKKRKENPDDKPDDADPCAPSS